MIRKLDHSDLNPLYVGSLKQYSRINCAKYFSQFLREFTCIMSSFNALEYCRFHESKGIGVSYSVTRVTMFYY